MSYPCVIVTFQDIETSGPEFEAASKMHQALKSGGKINIAGALVIPEDLEEECSTLSPEAYRNSFSGIDGVIGSGSAHHTFKFKCRIVRDES